MLPYGWKTCERCREPFEIEKKRQKYCPKCRAIRRKETRLKWWRKNRAKTIMDEGKTYAYDDDVFQFGDYSNILPDDVEGDLDEYI